MNQDNFRSEKKLFIKIIIPLMLTVFLLSVFVNYGCKKSEKTNNTSEAASLQTSTTVFSKFLNVGIDATFPPFAYLQGEEIVGFDVDLAGEIAKRLEKELKITQMSYNEIYEKINEPEIDIIISAIIPNQEKSKTADFSDPYYTLEYTLITLTTSKLAICLLYTSNLVGREIMDNYKIVNHYARDRQACKMIGNTRRGTPVIINKTYLEADFRILTGLIEPHFMAGFSGGRKAICPGISYMDMFKHFHGPEILESPFASNAVLENNPFHMESLEIAKMAGVDFIVNVTINKNKEITGIFSGDLEAAFYEGAAFCKEYNSYKIKGEADIVITSGGGLPLDATLYLSLIHI